MKRVERAAPDAEDATGAGYGGRKRQCVNRAGCAADTALTDASIERFHACGFVVVPKVLTSEELAFLRDESDQLFTALDADPAQATQKIVEQVAYYMTVCVSCLYMRRIDYNACCAKGCVLDTMAECPMAENASARVNQDAYVLVRTRQVRRLCAHATAATTTPTDVSVFARLLFDRLSRHAQRLLDTPEVFFFNEHYVVKPPHSHVEFRWHRDDDEQLGMCVHRREIAPYVSAWCALDDVTADNGPLRFVPLDVSSQQELHGGVDQLEKLASEPLIVEAGTVVLFLSNVWHCSSSNDSSATRRAFYAQFSREPITASPHDNTPLSFAIPCGEPSPEE